MVPLWPGGRGSSALPRVQESSIQLIFSPFPALLLSPEGGRTDIVWSTSSGSCYAWQEVQPLRPSALREAEGPRFWQGEQEERGEKAGVMQHAARTPRERLPGTREPPRTLAGGGSGAQERVWQHFRRWGLQRKRGAEGGFVWPPGPEQAPAHLSTAGRDDCPPDLL